MTNISSRSGFVIVSELEFSISNNAEAIELALKLMKEVIDTHEETTFLWMKHSDFDSYAFVLKISYNILDFLERHRVQSEINTKIIDVLKKENIEFNAMPIRLLDK